MSTGTVTGAVMVVRAVPPAVTVMVPTFLIGVQAAASMAKLAIAIAR